MQRDGISKSELDFFSVFLQLHLFLQQLVGFDSVDDESKSEFMWRDTTPLASEWTSNANPPYRFSKKKETKFFFIFFSLSKLLFVLHACKLGCFEQTS